MKIKNAKKIIYYGDFAYIPDCASHFVVIPLKHSPNFNGVMYAINTYDSDFFEKSSSAQWESERKLAEVWAQENLEN